MFTAPKKPPLIIGVTFNVTRAGPTSPTTETSCWREAGLKAVALTDAAYDWNQHFHLIAGDPSVTSATATVIFNHTLRVNLPIPSSGKGASLQSLGALVNVVADMMAASGEFPDGTPANHLILYVAAIANIPFASPSRGIGRQRQLKSKGNAGPRPPTETEWRKEQAREQTKKYREKHRDELNAKAKDYREKHRDELNAKAKDYREKHRDELITKARDYYEKNNQTIKLKQRERYAKKADLLEPR